MTKASRRSKSVCPTEWFSRTRPYQQYHQDRRGRNARAARIRKDCGSSCIQAPERSHLVPHSRWDLSRCCNASRRGAVEESGRRRQAGSKIHNPDHRIDPARTGTPHHSAHASSTTRISGTVYPGTTEAESESAWRCRKHRRGTSATECEYRRSAGREIAMSDARRAMRCCTRVRAP